MTTSERVYRRLLRLYPRTFRAAYEDEMARLFLDQLRDAGASGRRGALAGHWLRSLADIVMSAPAAYLQPEDATVAKAVDPGTVQLSVASQSNGPVRLGYALASIPFALLVSAFLARPDFMNRSSSNFLRQWSGGRQVWSSYSLSRSGRPWHSSAFA